MSTPPVLWKFGRFALFLAAASTAACSGDESTDIDPVHDLTTDTGGVDQSVGGSDYTDTGESEDLTQDGTNEVNEPDQSVLPSEWSHCPSGSELVQDESWEGQLSVPAAVELCGYPQMLDSLDDALASKAYFRIPQGDFRFATSPSDEGDVWFFPFCARSLSGGLANPTLGEVTTVYGESMDFAGGLTGGEFATGDADPRYHLTIYHQDGVATLSAGPGTYNSGVSAHLCYGEYCSESGSVQGLSCEFEPNMCDGFTFSNGWIWIDQYHWTGNAGSGFAAIVEASGELNGTSFSVSNYEQLVMTFGMHAFDRSALVFFDSPIGTACGLRFSEVAEYSQDRQIWTTDCDGQPLEQLTVTGEQHQYRGGCE
ncbi:MAG: hypothetical protein KC561_02360 [Myxococcales bacterium]|nr:hypothetical protein [Myxococcales bacterium]